MPMMFLVAKCIQTQMLTLPYQQNEIQKYQFFRSSPSISFPYFRPLAAFVVVFWSKQMMNDRSDHRPLPTQRTSATFPSSESTDFLSTFAFETWKPFVGFFTGRFYEDTSI